MPLRPCLRCGALTGGSYCPAHRPKRPGLNPVGITRGTKFWRWTTERAYLPPAQALVVEILRLFD